MELTKEEDTNMWTSPEDVVVGMTLHEDPGVRREGGISEDVFRDHLPSIFHKTPHLLVVLRRKCQ